MSQTPNSVSLGPANTAVKLGTKIVNVLDFFMHLTETIGAILLSIMTLTITWQVVTRFKVIHVSAPWTEEVALMLLVWFGMTGAAIGVRKKTHIGVEFVTNLFPKKMQHLLNIIIEIFIMIFAVFLFIEGLQLMLGNWNTMMPGTGMRRGLMIYTAVPAAAFLMFLYTAELIIIEYIPAAGGKDNV